ncbi:unnamed protein product [Paramecium pentaurelia]|uniref:Uncharacterized protein n=1 Tax=Paramecium pentaurelia TaxID=43138 RepID=A0A8S1XXX7_9CILI|nr:unnamed protein product [Paramecium pentaurelia]
MSNLFSRKHSDNSILKGRTQTIASQKCPFSTKENNIKFKYPEVFHKQEPKPFKVQISHTDMRSPSAQSTSSPINKSILMTHRSQSMFQDVQYIDFIITNKEVNQFLKRHFLHEHMHTNTSANRSTTKLICDSWEKVPVSYFIKALFNEYPEIIQDHKLNDKLTIQLKSLIKDLVSEDGQMLSLNKLQMHTRHLGLLSLLLTALRDIQEPPSNQENQDIQTNQQLQFSQQQQVQEKLSKYIYEFSNNLEKRLIEIFDQKLTIIQNKQIELEKLVENLRQRYIDHKFKQESQHKLLINNLTQQLEKKDQIIAELQQKLQIKPLLHTSNIENMQNLKCVNPKFNSSKLHNSSNDQSIQKFMTTLCNIWDMACINEDYRFAQILTAQDYNQMPFQHFQLIPIIKSIPKFDDFILKTLNSIHIITNFVQNCMNSDNNMILDIFQEIYILIQNAKVNDQNQYLFNLIQLFLKLTTCILHIKATFNANNLKDWLTIKKSVNEQQQQFIHRLITQIIQIHKFTLNQNIPIQLSSRQQQNEDKYQEHTFIKIIEDKSISNQFCNHIKSIYNKQQNSKLSILLRILQCFYLNEIDELIDLMQSVQGETEIDIFLSKWILDSNCISLILFPNIFNQKYTLKAVTILLQFKCPQQFQINYTKQVCDDKHIELLIDILMRMHQTQNQELIFKIWELFRAISKSTNLKVCKDKLEKVIKLYSGCHHATLQNNIQQVNKNLAIQI